MKKSLQAASSAFGAAWIVFWVKSLDTTLGCVCFALSIVIFVGSWISIFRDVKKKKRKVKSNLPKRYDCMKRKKLLIVTIIVLIVFIGMLCVNVFVRSKFIKTYTYTELEYRGYTAQDVREITIKHSYLNRILSYNEWRISVEFEKEPNILFWFTYRDNKIIFQGVSSEPMLDKESVLDYSERFKKGTLLDK